MIKFNSLTYRQLNSSLLKAPQQKGVLYLWWLGQAGFALRYNDLFALIDPYLSDFLEKKYRRQKFLHKRLMPPPLIASEISGLDWVLCTHRHSDHMDPETLALLAANNKKCRFVVPNAEREFAINLGLPENRVEGVNCGDDKLLQDRIRVRPVAAAHEEFETNHRGEHHFLGYILKFAGMNLFHSGDGIPYSGLKKKLRKSQIDIALLPVNGRDEFRKSHGVPGNFTLMEAIELCDGAGIQVLLGHHFGMFDFNTIDLETARITLKRAPPRCRTQLANMGKKYSIVFQ
jgi:L-ascorbate metabolism protein UlaG (beta-lactamase superfamily)